MKPKYSQEAMDALIAYIKAFDICANTLDESYGAVFIEMDSIRERLRQFFTAHEFNAIIINMDELKEPVE